MLVISPPQYENCISITHALNILIEIHKLSIKSDICLFFKSISPLNILAPLTRETKQMLRSTCLS